MKNRFLTIKYTKPIPVQFKDGVNLLNAISDYIDCYGDCFIGLFNDYDEAIQAQQQWYELYGDIDICKDLITIDQLEKCLALNLDTNI